MMFTKVRNLNVILHIIITAFTKDLKLLTIDYNV